MLVRVPKKSNKGAKVSEANLLKAIPDSAGNLKTIAERVGVGRNAIYVAIRQKRWPAVNEAYEEELERMGDIAEETIKTIMQQRIDLGTAARTARWFLERKHTDRGYKPKKEVTLEGGQTPLQIHGGETLVCIETLQLPIEVKKQVLEAMRKQIADQNAAVQASQNQMQKVG